MVTALNYSDLSKWINSHPGGKGHSGRRNAYVFAHALLNWAQKNGWLGQDILKGMEKPGVNVLKNIMPVAQFEKILRACAASDEFRSILPVLVLRGLAGVRDCELVGKRVNQPDVIYWTDFNWAKGWLLIRDEVAKQTTRKSGDQRWVTLPPAAIEWLKPLAQGSGPVFAGNRDSFGEMKKALLKSAGLKMARYTLRHSYATYSITCGSLAAAAKNMGDTESRVKSTYENPDIEPETGLAWFALRPQGPGNIVQMGTAA
jgi:integrase